MKIYNQPQENISTMTHTYFIVVYAVIVDHMPFLYACFFVAQGCACDAVSGHIQWFSV